MAYEIEFTTTVVVEDPKSSYINDCCWGGDAICNRLLLGPSVFEVYGNITNGQEDWGWYIWMRQGRRAHRIHVQCDDIKSCAFRIHVFSSEKGWWHWKGVDTLETDRINEAVVAKIRKWGVISNVKRYTPDFNKES